MRFHFSCVSLLALATAASLALPSAAIAADFVYRDGQKVSTSLELPAEGTNLIVDEGVAEQAGVHNAAGNSSGFTKSGAGQLILSGESLVTGPVTIQAGLLNVTGTLTAPVSIVSGALNVGGAVGNVTIGASGTMTNNGSAIFVTSSGDLINNAGMFRLLMNGGSAANNSGATIYISEIAGGELINNGAIRSLTIAGGAGLVNNQGGNIKSLTNSGITTNDGAIESVDQRDGSFANGSDGTIYGVAQNGGVTTNDGTITYAHVNAGTLTNNASGQITNATINGGTLLNGGTIATADVEADGSLTNNADGTITTLNNAGIVTNAGLIGVVTQTGGSLTNSGTITGLATIDGGTLANNNALNQVAIAAGASLVNNQTGLVRVLNNSGATSNDGSMRHVNQSAGTLVNQANGTFQGLIQTGGVTTNNGKIGSVILEGGTLALNEGAELGQAVLTGGTLQNSGIITNLTVSQNGTFANNATGKAAQVISGGTGSNSGTIDNLHVNGGTFNNSGEITAGVSVNAGVFSSTGMVGGALNNLAASTLAGTVNGTLTNSGVLDIADDLSVGGDVISSGTINFSHNQAGGDSLTAGGDVTLTATSVIALDIGSDGTHDTLSAAGDVMLGGRLNVTANGEAYGLKSTFAAFTSTAGTVAGQFAEVVVASAGHLFGTLEENATGLVLAIRNRDVLDEKLKDLDLGENGEILDGFDYSGQSGAQMFDAFASVDAENAPRLMSQITGAATSAVMNAGKSAAQGFGSLIEKVAAASGLSSSNEGVLAYQKALRAEESTFAPVLRDGESPLGVWARGFGESVTGKGDGGDAIVGGVGAGADIAVNDALTIGVSLGYSMADFGQNTAVEGNTNSFHSGTYLAMGATAPEAQGFGLTASGSYSKHDTHSKRTIKLGELSALASAGYGGSTLSGTVMVRNGFTVGHTMPLTIAPVAGLKFALDRDDAYTETGAGVLNLTVSEAKRKSLVGIAGLQLASRIETQSVVFIPHVSGVYQHEFLDTSSTTTRKLAGSDTSFTVTEGSGSRSSVALEAGLGLKFSSGLSMDVSGYGVISDGENRYGANATLKAGF